MNQDIEHLQLLSIFHKIVAGLLALFSCFPIIHVALGVAMFFAPSSPQGSCNDPEMMRIAGAMMALFAGGFVLAGWITAICIWKAGRNLKQHRHRTFCLVMAGIACVFVPFGTVLGVFTIIVLTRPSVQLLFEQSVADPFAAAGGA